MDKITLITNTDEGLREWVVNNGFFVISKYKQGKFEIRYGTNRHPTFDTFDSAVKYVLENQS